MWIYIFTVLLCLLLWKTFKSLRFHWTSYWDISRAVAKFPVIEENHWFLGLVHLVHDFDSYVRLCTKHIERTHHAVFVTWILFIRPGIMVVHPRPLKSILTASHYSAEKPHGWSGVYRFLAPWLGYGLLVSNGKKWERSRKLLTPAFHFDILRPYVAVFNNVADLLIRQLEEASAGNNSINICPYVSRATLDTMLRCALSYEDEGIQTDEGDPPSFYDCIYYWKSDGKEFTKHCDFVHEFASRLIEKRKSALKADPSQLQKRHLDFLDILLTAEDENGTGLSDQEIRDEVDTFMFEGHDTTASAIMWAIHSLGKHPEIQRKVREDVEKVLQGRACLEGDDIPKLEYTTRFIKESLRMYTPVPFISRILTEPVKLEGVTLPTGAVIDIHPHMMHHNPAVWDNHMEFDPDRFLPEEFAKKDPFAFLPFSAGQRNCIGQHFAMNEIKVIISRIVTRFDVSLDKVREAVPFPEVVMSAKDGIYLHFSIRRNSDINPSPFIILLLGPKQLEIV